jgi:hypothetical protein
MPRPTASIVSVVRRTVLHDADGASDIPAFAAWRPQAVEASPECCVVCGCPGGPCFAVDRLDNPVADRSRCPLSGANRVRPG